MDLDDSGGDAAKWGNVAHADANFHLSTGLPVFGEDWVSAVIRPYINFVNKLPGEKVHEQKIVSANIIDFGGTIDTAVLDGTHLHIVDLKTGKYKVPAKNNTQLQCYMILARQEFPQAETFSGTIIQPMVYARPNTAEFTPAALDQFENRVAKASTSKAVVAGDHCRFCPLRPECTPGQVYAESKPYWS